MVLINGIKYACDRCIRGHRVSGCRHIEAPLKRIKRKGRPTTQGKASDTAGSTDTQDNEHQASTSPFSPPDTNDSPVSGNAAHTNHSGAGLSHNDANQEETSRDSKLLPVISSQELERLRHDPAVVIELPDGTVLSDLNRRRPHHSHSHHHQQYPHQQSSYHPYSHQRPLASKFGNYYNHMNSLNVLKSPSTSDERAALSNSMPHRFDHLNIISHSSKIQDEDLYRPAKSHGTLDQDYYEPLSGPYNADLYNDSMGNNVASAVMNLHGTGNYSPNTGTVALQPKIILNNDLYSTRQELANSLPGIERMKSNPPPIKREDVDVANDTYASTHIPKLSNLY